MACRSLYIVILPGLVAGCSSTGPNATVAANPFETRPAASPIRQASFNPASIQAAARVDLLGRKLVDANPQAGVRPLFRTIGAPQPEIFHHGTAEVDITEGLVRLCQTDGQLAAVLCQELGKMVSEREALAGPHLRQPQRQPPMDLRIGNDAGGSGPPDQTNLAELAKFERGRPPSGQGPTPPTPDPAALARSYLKRAQFAESELDAVSPILAAAAANCTFEKQFTAPPPPHP